MKNIPEPIRGDDLLSVKRYEDGTAHMAVFKLMRQDTPFGSKGEVIRRFLTDDEYKMLMIAEAAGYLRIQQHATVIEGHIVPEKKRRRHSRKEFPG